MKIIYSDLAYIYDKLMYDVDYKMWADYIEKIFVKQGVSPKLVLDLGCGTGSFSVEMAKRGYEMIGVDISADMLSCARNKAMEQGVDILFLNQDMTKFEMYGTVDIVLCLMDGINYILKKNSLKAMFKLIKNYLNPGGLFIFDINSIYKFENIFENNVFYDIGDEEAYVWQNSYNRRSKVCQFDLTFFLKETTNYKRFEEVHYERAYEIEELRSLLEDCRIKVLNVYNGLSFKSCSKKSNRIFFVCKV